MLAESPALPAHDGARLRVLNLLHALSGFDVDFVHFVLPGTTFTPIETRFANCHTVATVEHDNQLSRSGRLCSLLSIKPYGTSRNQAQRMHNILRSFPINQYDYVLVCGINMAQYRAALAGIKHAVLDVCDSEIRHMEVRARFVTDWPSKMYFSIQKQKAFSELSRAARQFDCWLVISTVEKESLEKCFPLVPIHVVGNAVLPSDPLIRQTDDHLIALSGNFDYYPNVDAALYFAKEVMPLVRRSGLGLRLRIVGKNPPEAVLRTRADDIEVTGFVPNINAVLAQAGVFVCPLRLGTGVKNKVLEAMSLGLAVISTAVGVEGIGAQNGIHYLEAETPADFMLRLCQVADLNTRGDLARAGRQFVLDHFLPQEIEVQLQHALHSRQLCAQS